MTVLVPFLDVARIDGGVLGELGELFAAHRPFDVRFAECRRFPDVLYLAPEPDEPLQALTEAVVARWPELPPYGGPFADVVPRLTVAHGQPEDVYAGVAAELAGRLPVRAGVAAVELWGSDGDRWHRRARFPPLATR